MKGRGKQTRVCGTLCINEPSLPLKVHPALRTIKAVTVTPSLPRSVLLSNIHPASVSSVTMARPNNWQFVNRTMCVCFRLTTAFPPSVSPSAHPTQDREIACNWLWMDCGWQEGRAVCLL